MRYGGELPESVREIVCAHFRDYKRKARLISGANRRGSKMIHLRRYNRIIDRAIEQTLSAHGISGKAAETVREDLFDLATGRKAMCVNGCSAMLSKGLYIDVREDALFFAARELGLV